MNQSSGCYVALYQILGSVLNLIQAIEKLDISTNPTSGFCIKYLILMYYDFHQITGMTLEKPDVRNLTDEELGIPPDDVE